LKLSQIAYNAGIGDEESILLIVEKFMPSIKKFARELSYPEAETDLIICLLEGLPKYSSKFTDDVEEGIVVSYIYRMLKNKKIDLFRKNVLRKSDDVLNDDLLQNVASTESFEDEFELLDSLNMLTSKQKKIIVLKYYHGYSDDEISKLFNISRQSVNKIKIRALEKLNKTYQVMN